MRFLRPGVTLHVHPDRRGRDVEQCAADADRQPLGELSPFALQVGHNRYATSAMALAVIPQASRIGIMWPWLRQSRR